MKIVASDEIDIAVDAELLAAERVLIMKGSEALRNRKLPSGKPMVDRADKKREEMVLNGQLVATVRNSNLLIFSTDVVSDSPTSAADIVFGANKSGREFWRSSADGKSLVDHFGPAR